MRAANNEEAGSGGALAGFEDATAVSPASPDTLDEQLSPVSSSETSEGSGVDLGSPCEASIDGADLLDRMLTFYRRFVRLPSESGEFAIALWAAHAHLMEAWDTTPRLAFLSAEPGSGKSRAMEVVALFTPRSLEAANASTASLIRAIDDPEGVPTYFIDEIDTKYGSNAKGDEELRGFINAGHRRGGSSLRCEPTAEGGWVPKRIFSYAAVAMAGIGDLPDTILTRSIVLRMRRRALGEWVEPYRQRDHKHLGHALRDELEDWARIVADRAAKLRPNLPSTIVDRNADVWEPLIAVADLAGGQWPARARAAAVEMIQTAKETEAPSLGIQLLTDIRTRFGTNDRLSTVDLLGHLLSDEEAPWGDIKGRQLDARRLATMLKPFGIRSSVVRQTDGTTPRGYKREDFHDAWKRYLPPPPENATSATSATSATASPEEADGGSVANVQAVGSSPE